MEYGYTVTPCNELIDLINKVEDKIKADGEDWRFPINWAFTNDWQANGLGEYIEFGVSVGSKPDGSAWQSVYWREIGKHDNDNWEQHPLDDEYEEPELVGSVKCACDCGCVIVDEFVNGDTDLNGICEKCFRDCVKADN